MGFKERYLTEDMSFRESISKERAGKPLTDRDVFNLSRLATLQRDADKKRRDKQLKNGGYGEGGDIPIGALAALLGGGVLGASLLSN